MRAKKKRPAPPVETGHDARSREAPPPAAPGKPQAPDGVSGDWG